MADAMGKGLLLLIVLALAYLMCAALFGVTPHVEARHPDAVTTGLFGSSFDCRFDREDRSLWLTLNPFACPPSQKIGGVIVNSEGETITGFWAKARYWLRVLSRDGYAGQ